ncbi:MAG: hypothetical protein ACK559_34265, partial [bacterium]
NKEYSDKNLRCEHGARATCKICKGRLICPHNNQKYHCKICDFDNYLKSNIMNRMYSVLGFSNLSYLGTDIVTYKNYLESKFPSDITWKDYGTKFEIDHIKPLKAKGITQDEMIRRLHFSNTQPLDPTLNKRKGNKE